MGRVTWLRTVVAAAVVCSAAAASGECISQLRDTSSGVFNRNAAAVAWSGTTLGVAKIDDSNSRAISFATYSENLNPLTSDRTVADASFAGVTSLLWNGSEFALFYQTPFGRQLVMQRISATGNPIGVAVAISTNHPAASDREYDIAWDTTRQAYVVGQTVYSGFDKGLWVTFVNRDGSTGSEQFITVFVTSPSSTHVAVNATGTVAVVFRRSGTFNLQLVDATGATGSIQPVMTARDVRIASNGTGFAVVGSVPATTTSKEIDWTTVDEHGGIGPVLTLVTARGAEIALVSLAWNPSRSEWALGYLDSLFGFSQIAGDYRLRRFTESGALLSDSAFSPDPLLTRLSTTLPFAWTGSSYVTAASRSAAGTTPPESFVIRHCPLTAIIDTPLLYVRAVALVTFSGRTDGGAGDPSYSWQFSDTGEMRSGQTVTHQYARTGDFDVTLRVTDASGATSVTTSRVHVVTPRRRAINH